MATQKAISDPSVMPVPREENWLQGGIIAGAYLLEKIQPGDDYVVIVTP